MVLINFHYSICLFLGALLSHFISPVYLSSIVLGSLYHADHLVRAIHKRCEHVKELPEGYKTHCPQLSSITNIEARQPGKAPNFATNWLAHDSRLEIVDCANGKTNQGLPSRLCKNDMYRKFSEIWHRMDPVTRCSEKIPSVYHEAKNAVISYQFAKTRLYESLSQMSMGQWMSKPQEQDQFQLETQVGLVMPGVPLLTPTKDMET